VTKRHKPQTGDSPPRRHPWSRPDDDHDPTTTACPGAKGGQSVIGRPSGISLTRLRGSGLRRVFYLQRPGGTVGRHTGSDVHLPDRSVSRNHARIVLDDEGAFVEDLGSVNGTWLGEHRTAGRTRLPDSCRLQFGPRTLLQAILLDEQGARAAQRMQRQLFTDTLTTTGNRRFLGKRLREEMSYALRHGLSLGLLLADLDHFKLVNDTFGHQHGDEVLARVGAVLQSAVRDEDSVYRYGGEEFCVLVRGATEEGLFTTGERLRAAVERLVHPTDQGPWQVTASIGGACLLPGLTDLAPTEDDEDDAVHEHMLVALADEALYEAKSAGRNGVVVNPCMPMVAPA